MKRKRSLQQRAVDLVARMDALVRRFARSGPAPVVDIPLAPREIRVLDLMWDRPTFRMGELAQAAALTLSGLTAVIDGLVAKQLVERTRLETDRRVVQVQLTAAGRRLGEHCRQHRLRMARALLQPLNDEEQELFLELLGRSTAAAPVQTQERSS